ncbi:hypothetical protein MBLNU230_g2481t1 [Neophaeotheca triangularis]
MALVTQDFFNLLPQRNSSASSASKHSSHRERSTRMPKSSTSSISRSIYPSSSALSPSPRSTYSSASSSNSSRSRNTEPFQSHETDTTGLLPRDWFQLPRDVRHELLASAVRQVPAQGLDEGGYGYDYDPAPLMPADSVSQVSSKTSSSRRSTRSKRVEDRSGSGRQLVPRSGSGGGYECGHVGGGGYANDGYGCDELPVWVEERKSFVREIRPGYVKESMKVESWFGVR